MKNGCDLFYMKQEINKIKTLALMVAEIVMEQKKTTKSLNNDLIFALI